MKGSPQEKRRGTHADPGKWRGGVSATRDAEGNAREVPLRSELQNPGGERTGGDGVSSS